MTSQKTEVAKFRDDFEMTEQDMADLLGVTYQAVRLWERRLRKTPVMVLKLMRLFTQYPQLLEQFK